MKNYVIICVQHGNNMLETVLILKDAPAWQKGRLNLPGGKIESTESPLEAAIRELKEETGYDPLGTPNLLGEIRDGENTIFCFHTMVRTFQVLTPRPEETEVADWYYLPEIIHDPRLIPNLRIIIPMIMCGCKDWVITDDFRGSQIPFHKVEMSIPTYYANFSEQ